MRAILMFFSLLLCTAPVVQAATLLVLNKADATLLFVDPASGDSLGTVATGEQPHEVEVSRDGRTAVVSNYGAERAGDSLSVINLASRGERRIALEGMLRPHGLTATPDGVYFTAEDSQQVGRLNLGTAQVDWRAGTGQDRTHMVLGSRDGQTLFTSNVRSGSISIIPVAANGAQKVVQVGNGPEGLDLSPDGSQLWVGNSAGGNIAIVDVAQQKVVETFAIGTRRSNRVKFTPDGKLVLVSDLQAGELVVIDVLTRTVKERLKTGPGTTGILVVPDGSRAYVAVSGERHLAIINLKTLTIEGVVATGNNPDGMAWVP
jgi:YVTN family beta-propeller protein